MKLYRGSAAAARSYVEADRSRADDYYLAEGTGLAQRFVATVPATRGGAAPGEPGGEVTVRAGGTLDGDGYEAWVAGYDQSSTPKGRLRTDERGVRFAEVVVNGPKTWSLAAAVDPEIAAAYDRAQERAAREIIGWLAAHSTTRIGPRGRQVQVPVEQIEACVIRHYTSRAGDPHRHLHLQVNARVKAAGRWRGIHTVGVRDSLDAINGIGHAAIMCDPDFRGVLAQRGYTLDTTSGEVRDLTAYVGAFSARAAQIGRNVDRYEAEWRAQSLGHEPGPRLRRAWDARAWAQARPDKVVPRDGAELARRWVGELSDLGFRPPGRPAPLEVARIGWLDRAASVEVILTRLGARRSAWNQADVRGEAEQLIASAGIVAEPGVRRELAEDLTSRTLAACVPLLARDDVPEHVRSLTSPQVVAVEADLTTRLTSRAEAPVARREVHATTVAGLDAAQRTVVAALAGRGELLVIEGAAGAGKTRTLAAARGALARQGRRLVVVTPTLKAAQVAARQLGTEGFSAAWLAYQHGFRWDDEGRSTRLTTVPPERAQVRPGDVLLVDEAGMLDQDTARALLTIADEAGAGVALVGDRHQLPAVGRGGVLDHAARYAAPGARLKLEVVHRFTDPDYARVSLLMRTGERGGEVFDTLCARGQIIVHRSEAERHQALTQIGGHALVIADTREQVAALNGAIRDRLTAAGQVDDATAVTTRAGQRIGVGDRVATRANDRDLDVANRDTWIVTDIGADGSLHVEGDRGRRVLPVAYVEADVELGYASTVYGAQGETASSAHLLLGEQTGAAAAYVGMTRGRDHNTAHLVADSTEDARRLWVEAFSRDRADLGPAHAARAAADDIDRYGPALSMQKAALCAPARKRSRPREDTPSHSSPRPSSQRSRGVGI